MQEESSRPLSRAGNVSLPKLDKHSTSGRPISRSADSLPDLRSLASKPSNGEFQNDHFQVLFEGSKTAAETTSKLKSHSNSNAAQEARDQLREKKKSLRQKLHQRRSGHDDDGDEFTSPCATESAPSKDGD